MRGEERRGEEERSGAVCCVRNEECILDENNPPWIEHLIIHRGTGRERIRACASSRLPKNKFGVILLGWANGVIKSAILRRMVRIHESARTRLRCEALPEPGMTTTVRSAALEPAIIALAEGALAEGALAEGAPSLAPRPSLNALLNALG